MRCYQHGETEAAGVCVSCGRGLCRACAAEVGKALACRDRCEAETRALLAGRAAAGGGADHFRAGSSVMYLAIGGALAWYGHDASFALIMWLGASFVAFALFGLTLEAVAWRKRRARRRSAAPSS